MPKVFLESVARQDPWYAKDLVWFMVIFKKNRLQHCTSLGMNN